MKRLLPLSVAALLLFSSVAQASVVLQTSVSDMTRLSVLVARGEVTQVESRKKSGGGVETVVTLDVTEVLKGDSKLTQVDFVLPGGRIGELAVRAPGTPTFLVGEEVVVFLEAGPRGFVVCGQEQGRFRIQRSTKDKIATALRRFSRGVSFVRPGNPTDKASVPTDDSRPLAELREAVRATTLRFGDTPQSLKKVFPVLAD